MISVDEARSAVLERAPVLGAVTLSLRRAAGLRLAADVRAESDVPPFDNAAMDGYAVRAADTAAAPAMLAVDGENAAGSPPGAALAARSARVVMTGGPLPPGADAVVRVEWTEREGDGPVRVVRAVKPGASVRRTGSDIAAGSIPLRKGRELRAFELGVLASLGIAFVGVHRAPAALVIPTGNELAAPGRPLGPGMIRESNTEVVAALARAEGCGVTVLPPARDDRASILEALAGRGGADAVILTGGVSAGRYDLVPDALKAAGAEIVFHRVNMKPGKPALFAMLDGAPVFALPGNPVSAAVTFLQFVRPALRKMAGDPDPGRRATLSARLAVPLSKSDGKRHFVRGTLDRAPSGGATPAGATPAGATGQPTVRPAGSQESSAGSVLAAADCLIVLPEDRAEFAASEIVETELL